MCCQFLAERNVLTQPHVFSCLFNARCNISYLEEWLKEKNLQGSSAKETLQPLSQAAWLLQVKKVTDEDAKEIYERCTSLTTVQVLNLGIPYRSRNIFICETL